MLEEVKLVYINIRDEKMLAKLGEIVTIWAFGEAVVEDMIAGLLVTEVLFAYTLTANINITTRLKAIQALGRMRFDDAAFAVFKSHIDQITELVPFRNKLVHGLWAETSISGLAQVSTVKSSDKLKTQSEYVNLDYLNWLSARITKAATSLHEFGVGFGLIKNG